MTVFKGYMKIVRKNIGLILMYFAIFMGLTILFQQFSGIDVVMDYQAESVRVAVVDEDGGSLAKGLQKYLGSSIMCLRPKMTKPGCRKNCFTGTWNTLCGYRNIF